MYYVFPTMRKRKISVAVDEVLVATVDDVRGPVPRGHIVELALRAYLDHVGVRPTMRQEVDSEEAGR